MKDLCFATMVRGDYEFLEIWINHHEKLAGGRANLVVVSHGPDRQIDKLATGCSIIRLPEDENPPAFEPSRREMFFGLVRAMLPYYRFVVIGDVDEMLTLDPRIEMPLGEYLASVEFESNVLTVCNFNLMHDTTLEPGRIELTKPILGQRRHGAIAGGYCKPMVFRGAVGSSAGSDSHRVLGEKFQLDRNLVCFHLAYFDYEMSSRMSREKLARYLELEEISEKPTQIGLWSRGENIHQRRLRRMRRSNAQDWDSVEVRAYFDELERKGRKNGFIRVHYKWIDHVSLPERFVSVF